MLLAIWKLTGETFAIYLGFENTQVQQADHREKSYKDKAYEILVAWLKEAGYTLRSWETT